jgi:hypothetical protein
MENTPVHKRQRNYNFDLSHKKRLLLLAQKNTPSAVCKEYNIPKGTFWGWYKQIDPDVDYAKGQMTFHTGPKPMGRYLENLIDSFIENQEEGQMECTVDSIVFEIIKFDKDFMNGDFSKIKKWLYRYLKRNDFSIRANTHVAQKLCDVDKCLDFTMYDNQLRDLYSS